MQPGKKSFTFPSGKEITIDASLITQKEYRQLFSPDYSPELEDTLLAKVCGMTAEEWIELSRLDWKAISKTVVDFLADPLSDPNSVSGCTST